MSLRICFVACLALCAGTVTMGAELKFRGSMLNVLEEKPDKNTGLDKIYIVYDTAGVDLIYHPVNSGKVKILNYSNLGGGYAEEVPFSVEGSDLIVKDVKGNSGYIIEDGDRRYYYWIVNYLPYRFDIKSVAQSQDKDCDATILEIDGQGDPIHYFTINGQQRTLNREISVEYTSQEWDNNLHEFSSKEIIKYYESLNNPLRIIPPSYSYTSYLVSGDKFLREWNWISQAESNVISPTAIMIMSEAVQDSVSSTNPPSSEDVNSPDNVTDEDENGTKDESSPSEPDKEGSNIIGSGDSGLGGSAPATISFLSYGTEGVMHYEWQLSTDPNFDDIEYRFNQREIDYTFNEEGTYYMRFIGSNSDGSCDAIGDVYTISIGASELKCPNAFSPDGDGVNDEWKVSYRSLLDFKCWIFDRFGHQIFYFEDPSMGWDGKRGGKLVAPGVYYYVIQATGADNKKYKKSGDINILRHRSVTTSGGNSTETE